MKMVKGKLYTYTINPGYTHEMFPELGLNVAPIRKMKTGDAVIYLGIEEVSDDYIRTFAARNLHYEHWKYVICGELVGWVIGTLTPFEEKSNGSTTEEGATLQDPR